MKIKIEIGKKDMWITSIILVFLIGVGLVIAGLLEAIVIGWVYGADKLRAYINEISEWKLYFYQGKRR